MRVLEDHRRGHGVDHHLQESGLPVELRLDPLAVGDVAVAAAGAEKHAPVVEHRMAHVPDPAHLAVGPPDAELDLLGHAVFGRAAAVRIPEMTVLGVDDPLPGVRRRP